MSACGVPARVRTWRGCCGALGVARGCVLLRPAFRGFARVAVGFVASRFSSCFSCGLFWLFLGLFCSVLRSFPSCLLRVSCLTCALAVMCSFRVPVLFFFFSSVPPHLCVLHLSSCCTPIRRLRAIFILILGHYSDCHSYHLPLWFRVCALSLLSPSSSLV